MEARTTSDEHLDECEVLGASCDPRVDKPAGADWQVEPFPRSRYAGRGDANIMARSVTNLAPHEIWYGRLNWSSVEDGVLGPCLDASALCAPTKLARKSIADALPLIESDHLDDDRLYLDRGEAIEKMVAEEVLRSVDR
jgi:hypothetical protein